MRLTDAYPMRRTHILLEEANATGALLRTYTWGPGIDNLLAITVHGAAETNTYFALTDHLGTIHALADDTGAVAEAYRYDAWGNVLGVFDGNGQPLLGSALGNRFLFHGREYSWTTGLYNFRARWYDPTTGRWLSKDPIGISGGLNQYVFCGNNPVNFVDPFGTYERFSLKLNDQDRAWLVHRQVTDNGSIVRTSYPVYSGNDEHRNNPASANVPKAGPIPPGTYYIVDRPSGGRLGPLRDWLTGRNQWFGLFANDARIDDYLTVDGVERGEFRLHPEGPRRQSLGCITCIDSSHFAEIRELLLNTDRRLIPCTDIWAYGEVTVCE
ncbi:MAG: DUF2778 domain-containing protein [Candidatus Pacebacteria bacterium]|nr:DUF2778 domain-containing protein [Candidatus Paceibacterota bacterium]